MHPKNPATVWSAHWSEKREREKLASRGKRINEGEKLPMSHLDPHHQGCRVTRRRRDSSGSSSDRSLRDLPRAKLDKIGSDLKSRRRQKKNKRGCKRQSPKDKSVIMMQLLKNCKRKYEKLENHTKGRHGDRRTGQAREKQVSPPCDAQCRKRKEKKTPYESWPRME